MQGDDKLYINLGETLLKTYVERPEKDEGVFGDTGSPLAVTSTLAEGRQWVVVPMPAAYSGTNWPIRVRNTVQSPRHGMIDLIIPSSTQQLTPVDNILRWQDARASHITPCHPVNGNYLATRRKRKISL